MNISIEHIAEAANQSARLAKEQELAVCITVVDRGGHIVYQYRMDDANYLTNEVSYLKAKTAYLFKCPTHILRNITEKQPVLLKAIQLTPGDACLLEGGLPLTFRGKCVGGVGISGGNFEQDLLIASTFVEKLNIVNNGN
jgi:uncharacterized protein GlcG (DUF336 family)